MLIINVFDYSEVYLKNQTITTNQHKSITKKINKNTILCNNYITC